MEDDHDLAVGPFLDLVGAVIPDIDASPTVFAFGNVTFEIGVIKRMILGLTGSPFGNAQETRTPSRSSRKSQ
jgi:hypothetical protein